MLPGAKAAAVLAPGTAAAGLQEADLLVGFPKNDGRQAGGLRHGRGRENELSTKAIAARVTWVSSRAANRKLDSYMARERSSPSGGPGATGDIDQRKTTEMNPKAMG